MNPKQQALLKAELDLMDQASAYLAYSYQRCEAIIGQDSYSPEQLERLESLSSRFARLSDIIIQKIFRLLDKIDLEDTGTVRDRIYRAEKKALIDNADIFIDIRELRNSISHQYDQNAMQAIFIAVMDYSPVLFATIKNIHHYQQQYRQS